MGEMSNTMPSDIALEVKIAILETKYQEMENKLDDVIEKLDKLLELKTKGMGALGLAGLIISSGVIGVIMMVVNMFKGGGSHLG